MNFEIHEINASDTYQLRHSVMWPNKPIDYIKLDNDEEGVHFGLFLETKLVSVISLFTKDNNVQFRKFATETSKQGLGYGSKLFQYMLEFIYKKNFQSIWCNARLDKTTFYLKFGFNITDRTFTKGGIDYVIMEKIIP